MAKNKNQNQGQSCPLRKTSIGGQALMEGIMMRGPALTAMAVRNTKGEIVIESFPTQTKKRPAILKLPIIRGVVGFIDSMTLGYKCLMRSAEISGLEELEAEMALEKAQKKAAKKAAKAAKKASKQSAKRSAGQSGGEVTEVETTPAETSADTPADTPAVSEEELKKAQKESGATTGFLMVVLVVISFALMAGLFFYLPSFLYDLVEKIPGYPQDNRYLRSIFESVVRILLMVGYMGLMCLMKDTRRTFQFHGAEHKAIFCYERGLELTVDNVRAQGRFHPRCGTSFLVTMMLVGILIGFFVPTQFPGVSDSLYSIVRAGIKLLLMPLTMGVGYEVIKLCGRRDNWLTRLMSAPGLAFQRITVLEPDDAMIECAITALTQVIPEDGSDQI